MFVSVLAYIRRRADLWFLFVVLLFVNLYSFSTLTTKPAYWYDEAINVELARNFSDFGKLDLVIAPHTFSGKGATVGSTGYPVTAPLAGFFKLFGFGLAQARIYMLLWVSALVLVFFFIAKKLWGTQTAYMGTLLITTFAPFYGNGRSVMGEIPGFLFFLLSFYFLEKKKFLPSGILLGLAIISKPSVFVFFIPAYAFLVLCSEGRWKSKIVSLVKLGDSSLLALLPWLIIYVEEISRGGLGTTILEHFKNPYAEAGVSAFTNISNNLPTLFISTTLLYMWSLLAVMTAALFFERNLFGKYRSLFLLSAVYLPLVLLQYLKSFGYLRYLIAFELITFILFLISLPELFSFLAKKYPEISSWSHKAIPILVGVLIIFQTIHLFWFSDIYPSEKTQHTLTYLSRKYPDATVGVFNVPQIASLIPADKKYQYLSTFGLSQFGVNPLYLSPEKRPGLLVLNSADNVLTADDKTALALFYEEDMGFREGFLVYKKK